MDQFSLKYAILGDIRSNLEALLAVLNDAQARGCNRYACVGDIVGYNAHPRECLATIREMAMPCVKGNHDEYSTTNEALESLNPRASAAMLWTRQQLGEEEKQWLRELRYTRLVSNFSIVHATLDAPERWGYVFDRLAASASLTYQNTSVCFFGHTHVPWVFIRDTVVHASTYTTLRVEPGRKYFVNVGSVGEPRDGNSSAAYVTYDLGQGSIELRRVPYDVAKVEANNRAVGLPPRRKG
jgi:predicted phosphodiesterase